MLIAQISDLHIRRPGQLAYRRLDTAPFLARCIARLNQWAPRIDAVLITGDLVDAGHAEEYAHLRTLLQDLRVPYYLLVGNHDRREGLRAVFTDAAYLFGGNAAGPGAGDADAEFIQYTVDLGTPGSADSLRVIALDTLDAPHSGGRLCARRLAWLERALEASAGRPVVIALHHPPFRTGIDHMDEIALNAADARALAAIVGRHPNVERVICGHLHRPIHTRFAGTIASTAPSPAHQVALDLSPQGPSAFVMEPPAFTLHEWHPDAGLVSHHGYLEAYDGPYPFHDDNGVLID